MPNNSFREPEIICDCSKCQEQVPIPPGTPQTTPDPRGIYFVKCPKGCGTTLTVIPRQT